jgi:hydroxymethylpyrimidine/phosphomethylpyrimidine kinase
MQADLLTLASLGCHPLSVVTAITIQDTIGVEDMLPIDADWMVDQARCVLEDVPVDAFKVGVIGSVEGAAAIAEVVSDYPDVPLILDPVLASGRGDELASENLMSAMCELLLPQTTVLTPNSHEARRLASQDGDEVEDLSLKECAARLLELGTEYVLVSGTHESTAEVTNTLYATGGLVRSDSWQRCTLAAALAAYIAHGLDVASAARSAQEFTWQTLESAYRAGMGQLVPDRFFWAHDDEGMDEAQPG